jgi:hypothetical protein
MAEEALSHCPRPRERGYDKNVRFSAERLETASCVNLRRGRRPSALAQPVNATSFLFTRFGFCNRLHGQLQDSRFLALTQESKQERLPIREFERIMVHVRLRSIDLTEDCSLMSGWSASAVGADFAIESKLSARKNTHGCGWVLRRSEAACAGAEIAGPQPVPDTGGT